jgi:hypothetical protein
MNRSDPMNRLRNCKGDVLTLCYSGYDHGLIVGRRFRSRSQSDMGRERQRGSRVDRPSGSLTAYERALNVELPEALVLPYEWPQEGDHYWRVFRVPAEMLNRVLGFGSGEFGIGDR